jgi:beta propeller repeat protein
MLNKFLILLVTSLVCLLFVGAASAVTNSEPVDRSSHATVNSAIDGHQLVYEYEYSSTDHDIYKKDMVTGTTTVVTRDANDECNPDISGNIVVWQSRASGGKWQIYWKEISAPAMQQQLHASSK